MALTYVGESGQSQQSKGRSGSLAQTKRATSGKEGSKGNEGGNRGNRKSQQHVVRQSSLLQPGQRVPAPASRPGAGHRPTRRLPSEVRVNLASSTKTSTVGGSSYYSTAASSSSLTPRAARMRRLKSCCRLTAEFLFTQVGVGALVITYTLLGASVFQYVETQTSDPDQVLTMAEVRRNSTVNMLWSLTDKYNVLHKEQWLLDMQTAILGHQRWTVKLVQDHGYDQRSSVERWSFPTALMFALSTISMIGYGTVVPRSDEGKILTMVYAGIGIPLYILYFMNMGKVFAAVLKFVYRKTYRWSVRRRWRKQTKAVLANQRSNEERTGEGSKMGDKEKDELPVVAPLVEAHYLDALERDVIVPSTTCLWVMSLYLLIGTVMFAEWEGWNYLDSIYFCVTSLAKIGFGDFVPGASLSIEDGNAVNQVKLVINFVYILVGMAIVAMCYYLLKEEVGVKVQKTKEAMAKHCRPCTNRIRACAS